MTPEEKFDLITRNLQEVSGKTQLLELLKERNLKIYWGTAPTGRIHVGYLVPLLKIADFLKAECEVTILFADLHAFLDSKTTLDALDARTEYYQIVITNILQTLDIDVSKLRFARGREFQLTPEYTMDVYKLNSIIKVTDAKKAGAEVVKQSDNPTMNGLLYPTLQALDEEYLKVDAQFGGVDQRKIFMFAKTYLPKLGYSKRIHLMNPMVSSLRKEKHDGHITKMSASDINTKIDVMDGKKKIKTKIGQAYCLPGDITDNTPLQLLEHVIYPILFHRNEQFVINRPEQYGGLIVYDNLQNVIDDFANEKLHPADLKQGLSDSLITFLEPIRELDINDLIKKAYN